MNGRVCASLAGGVLALCAAAPASACHGEAGSRQLMEYTVGYAVPAALRAVAAEEDAMVVARIPPLRVATVRVPASAARRIATLPGIRFVQPSLKRFDAAEPALQVASGQKAAPEWQFAASREDVVPDWVLRAASAITIAVVDTGADLSAPDLAAKNPQTFGPRSGGADV